MCDFSELFDKLNYQELLSCKGQLEQCITKAKNKHREIATSQSITDYVDEPKPFLPTDSVEYAGIMADLESLDILSACKSGSTATRWLTSTGQDFVWETSAGKPVVKNPTSFEDYPFLKKALNSLNDTHGLKLNSCLVSCLERGKSCVRLHDDAEEAMDSNQPIMVLSMGMKRKVDFLGKYQRSTELPVLTVSPESGSIYTMKAGCQAYFKHRVPTDKSVSGVRYSISFRCMKTGATAVGATTPVKELASKFEGQKPSQFTPPPTNTKPNEGIKFTKKKTTVIFGTSITSGVVGSRLGMRGRTVINRSLSGAHLDRHSRSRAPVISDMVDDFFNLDPAANDIEKVILSFGTNDIKFATRGVKHLTGLVYDLINKVKSYFPGALIFVQCTLPIRNQYWYTVSNVLGFNSILREACMKTNCSYIDCFEDFLSYDRYDYNKALYRGDPWHLNKRGLGILCTWLKAVINRDYFNRVINHDYFNHI